MSFALERLTGPVITNLSTGPVMARFALSVPCVREAPEGRATPMQAKPTPNRRLAYSDRELHLHGSDRSELLKLPVRSAAALPMCTSPFLNCPV